MERGVYISAVGGKLSPCTVAYQIIESLIDSPGNVNKDGGGDPSFYFVLDLGASGTVPKLVIRSHYKTGDNEVLTTLATDIGDRVRRARPTKAPSKTPCKMRFAQVWSIV